MAKGPLLSERVKDYLAQLYLEQPAISAKEARQRLRSEGLLAKVGNKESPSQSAVDKELRRIRHRIGTPSSNPKDRPWTLGVSETIESSLTSVHTRVLLEILLACQVVGAPFTIRDASWAIKLLPALWDRPSASIYAWARRYSKREQLAEARGERPDTAAMDSEMAFTVARLREEPSVLARQWMYNTALASGAVRRPWMRHDPTDPKPVRLGELPGSNVVLEPTFFTGLEWSLRIGIEAQLNVWPRSHAIYQEASFPVEAVYVMWLRCIGSLSAFKQLEPDKRAATADELWREIGSHAGAEPMEEAILKDPIGPVAWTQWQPRILGQLGYVWHQADITIQEVLRADNKPEGGPDGQTRAG